MSDLTMPAIDSNNSSVIGINNDNEPGQISQDMADIYLTDCLTKILHEHYDLDQERENALKLNY